MLFIYFFRTGDQQNFFKKIDRSFGFSELLTGRSSVLLKYVDHLVSENG